MADAKVSKEKPRRRKDRGPRRVHQKLVTLPSNAKVTKRPLLRPAIPSPYAGASQQKVVYVSAKTPFMSTVKRVEKLLHLSDKRLVQAATTLAKQNSSNKRKRGRDDHDDVLGIAKKVEELKSKRRTFPQPGAGGDHDVEGIEGVGEEVLIKGTGKAIAKVMELGLWFQQREDQYIVRLRTGSVGAIDDIEVDEHDGGGDAAKGQSQAGEGEAKADAEEGEVEEDGNQEGGVSVLEVDGADSIQGDADAKAQQEATIANPSEQQDMPETRMRYVSSLEVAVSLR